MLSERLANVINPPPAQTPVLEKHYRRSIEQLLQANKVTGQPLSLVFSKMRGAFPSDIVACCTAQDLHPEVTQCEPDMDYTPHLHALNYEWYFTKESALNLSREFMSLRGVTICLGAPTIAAAGLRENNDLIFIDQNPLVLNRFPDLRRAAEIHLMDAFEAKRLDIKADTLIFDSPWYLGDTLGWLMTASHLIKPGGTIIFALYPPLTRVTSQLERDLILEFASAIGTVDVIEDVLTYQTPLFEREALKACGVINVGNWRHGDLVVVKAKRSVEIPLSHIKRRGSIDGPWETFVIGPQVIKLRATLRDRRNVQQTFLGKVEEDFVLSSVSASDTRRASIDVWTSENRVARAADISVLRSILSDLEAGISMKDAVQPYQNRFGTGIKNEVQAFLFQEN